MYLNVDCKLMHLMVCKWNNLMSLIVRCKWWLTNVLQLTFLKYRQHWTACRTGLSWLHVPTQRTYKNIEYRVMYADADVFEVWMRRAAEQLEVPSDAGFLAYDICPQGWTDGCSKLVLQWIEWLFKRTCIEFLHTWFFPHDILDLTLQLTVPAHDRTCIPEGGSSIHAGWAAPFNAQLAVRGICAITNGNLLTTFWCLQQWNAMIMLQRVARIIWNPEFV